MKISRLSIIAAIIPLAAALAGCGPADDGNGTTIIDCNLAAHHEVDGTSMDDANREFTLGKIVNACLKGKGLTPASSKPGCLVEPTSPAQGVAYVRATKDCWSK
jgi:hypothetical protein